MVARCQAATINARLALAREYRSRKVINVHDAKLAELVLAHRLFGTTARKYPKVLSWILLGSQVTEAFTFRTPALQELVRAFRRRCGSRSRSQKPTMGP